jgi:hypothetical protein
MLRRRRLKAGLAPVMSACLQGMAVWRTLRPNRVAAQASEPDISAKNRPGKAHDYVDWAAFSPTPLARSDEANHASASGDMDCFAEPVIGRAFARPGGLQ